MQYLVVHNVVVKPEARDMRDPKRIRYTGELLDEAEVDQPRLMRWLDAGYIVEAGARVHLLKDAAYMDEEARRSLFAIGVFTLEQFLAGQGDFINQPVTVDQWLAMNRVQESDVSRWKVLARAELAAAPKAEA